MSRDRDGYDGNSFHIAGMPTYGGAIGDEGERYEPHFESSGAFVMKSIDTDNGPQSQNPTADRVESADPPWQLEAVAKALVDELTLALGMDPSEPLEKRSKNVREHLARVTPSQAHQRIMEYLKRRGFSARRSTQDRFGVGKDQRELLYTQNAGSPDHELAHALMTPEGSTMRGYQQALSSPSGAYKGRATMTPEQGIADEMAAFAMQPGIRRRAGVPVEPSGRGPYSYHARGPKQAPKYEAGRERGTKQLQAHDEGRLAIDPKGKVQPGTDINARINERAARGGIFQKNENTMTPEQLAKAAGTAIQDRASLHAEENKGTKVEAKKDKDGHELGTWNGRITTHPDHQHELEREAAIHEFNSKLPRHEAEGKAYDAYRRKQLAMGAAHHYLGMKAAHSLGDMEEAQRHGALYHLHVKEMGHEPIGAVPDEVKQHLETPELAGEKRYKFKQHPADVFLLQGQEPNKKSESPMTPEQALENLAKALAEHLTKAQLHEFQARTRSPVADCRVCGKPRKHANHHQEPDFETWETKARRDQEPAKKSELDKGDMHTVMYHCPDCKSAIKLRTAYPSAARDTIKGTCDKCKSSKQFQLHRDSHLGSVEGGGETTEPKTGHLKVVKSDPLTVHEALHQVYQFAAGLLKDK